MLSRHSSVLKTAATFAAVMFAAPAAVAAEKKYDPGASDTEIKLGQTVPHCGPGSLYGVLGRVGEAYFQMLNEKGGINGRKIKFFTLDDLLQRAEGGGSHPPAGRAGGGAGAVRLARHRAADRRA